MFLRIILFAVSSAGGSGDLIHYYSNGAGQPPELRVDHGALCSSKGPTYVKRQLSSQVVPGFQIEDVSVDCRAKTISTEWRIQAGTTRRAGDMFSGTSAWADAVCRNHEIFFVVQNGWQIFGRIGPAAPANPSLAAHCDDFPLAKTDLFKCAGQRLLAKGL